jgi:hypothetical protein
VGHDQLNHHGRFYDARGHLQSLVPLSIGERYSMMDMDASGRGSIGFGSPSSQQFSTSEVITQNNLLSI